MSKFLEFIRDKHALWYKGFLFVVSVAAIVIYLPKQGHFKYEYSHLNGKPWDYENLIAPFDFPIYKSNAELKSEQDEIIKRRSFFFVRSDGPIEKKSLVLESYRNTDPVFYSTGRKILDSIINRGIIEQHDSLAGKPPGFIIQLKNGDLVEERKMSDFFTLRSADEFLITEIERSNVRLKDSLINLLESVIQKTILFDESLSRKNLDQDLSNISLTRSKILKGQMIINRGEILDDEKFQILQSLEREQKENTKGEMDRMILIIGQTIAAGLCVLMVFLFLAFFRKNIFSQNSDVTFIFLIIVFFILLGSLSWSSESIKLYAIPFAIAPIIIRSFFDTRTALFAHLNIVLLASFFASDRFEFIFVETLAGIAAIFSIANLALRSQLLISAFVVFSVQSLSFTALTFILDSSPESLSLADFNVFVISSLMVLMAYPLIFVFEKVFGFISDFTLIELSNANSNTLLRDLAVKAPGTFQHSLQVASMAEEAIQKIGGNPLLVRTGALYHDIGKMDNPRYFTENQNTGNNPHDELSPEESASIIISHVIRGIEMAKEARLPEQIIDFIRTHHGTSFSSFFYKKAIELYGEDQVIEKKYRYPGPIPFSKETAVLMMADSVEAASRSLRNYDAVSIDDLVERIINSKIETQQFINSDITFRDITNLKKLFKKRLMNIYHVRIEYPR